MNIKTFYIKTFGCQMNYADSEKIHMILMSAGLRKVIDPVKADIVIMNTCSVRQKGEDRVFGFMNEIARYHSRVKHETGNVKSSDSSLPTLQHSNLPLFGITGCMVRKSGMAKRYLPDFVIPTKEESLSPSLMMSGLSPSQKGEIKGSLRDDKSKPYKRHNAEKITLLESSDSLQNYDDELFLRSPLIDFTFRIEEVSFVTKILSLISGEDIGNDAKFHEYLSVKQLQESPASANIIIQTGCDNYCTFCIVPHTRGREVSRAEDEIVTEIREVVQNGTKEVTLLGQNVNSYGKETKAKLWNEAEMKWITEATSPALGATNSKEGERGSISIDGISIQRSEVAYKSISYNPKMKERARSLRKAGNLPEVIFWNAVKQKQFYGLDFDRQKIIGSYIVDFYSKYLGLIIEIDGSSHDGKEEYDRERQEFIEGAGLRVLRFTTGEIMGNMEGVLEAMKLYVVEQYGTTTPALRATPSGGRGMEPLLPNSFSSSSGTETLVPNSSSGGNSMQPLVPNSPSLEGVPEGRGSIFQTPFRELLEKIDEVEGLDRVRFTSSNPHDMTKDILDAHFDLPSLCPYLHFALQSGSDTMLRRMNRKHTYADFRAQVDYLRARDPLFSISTDIIVGFPGETEEEFQATATAMRECQFDFAFIARYSPRSGTIATTKYKDDISPEEKARRWTILNDILRESVHNRNALMVGREEKILISGEGKDDTWVGRTRNFKEVFIPKNPPDRGDTSGVAPIQVGDLVKVKITESEGWVLKGERI